MVLRCAEFDGAQPQAGIAPAPESLLGGQGQGRIVFDCVKQSAPATSAPANNCWERDSGKAEEIKNENINNWGQFNSSWPKVPGKTRLRREKNPAVLFGGGGRNTKMGSKECK